MHIMMYCHFFDLASVLIEQLTQIVFLFAVTFKLALLHMLVFQLLIVELFHLFPPLVELLLVTYNMIISLNWTHMSVNRQEAGLANLEILVVTFTLANNLLRVYTI